MEARLESGQLQLIQLIQPIQRDIRLVVLMHHVSGFCGRQVTAAENQSRTRSETIEARQLKLWLVMASGPWIQDLQVASSGQYNQATGSYYS